MEAGERGCSHNTYSWIFAFAKVVLLRHLSCGWSKDGVSFSRGERDREERQRKERGAFN